jgi:hypothetical protein
MAHGDCDDFNQSFVSADRVCGLGFAEYIALFVYNGSHGTQKEAPNLKAGTRATARVANETTLVQASMGCCVCNW